MQRSWKIITNLTNYQLRRFSRVSGYKSIDKILSNAVPLKVTEFNFHLSSVQFSKIVVNNINNIDNLVTFIETGRRPQLNDIQQVLASLKFDNLSEDQIVLLLECCGKSIPNASPQLRNIICQNIYAELIKTRNLNLNIYHTYIKICTENDTVLNHDIFLKSMICKPNHFTFRALLTNACEKGDILQVIDILNIFKEHNIPADEQIFSDLVLGHAIKGGLTAVAAVLETIRLAQIPLTDNIKFSIIKGLAVGNNEQAFLEGLRKYPLQFKEVQFLQLLEKLGKPGNSALISKVIELNKPDVSRDLLGKLETLCTHLIHSGRPGAAVLIYKLLVPNQNENYGQSLFHEMLLAKTSPEKIAKLAKEFPENPYLLEHTTGLALEMRLFDQVPKFFEYFPELKPHYFWPLLLNAFKNKGEGGLKNALEKMVQFNIKIDSHTLMDYVIPFLNYKEPELLVDILKEFNLTVRQIIEPLLMVLLQNKEPDLAFKICQRHNNVIIENGEILELLPKNFKFAKDLHSIVGVLQKICESKKTETDLVGSFLINVFEECTRAEDFNLYLNLLKILDKNKLKVNQASGDMIANLISSKVSNDHFLFDLKDALQSLVDFNIKTTPVFIPHPNFMDIKQLEDHLIELKSKDMETRGVLRKLILKYVGIGNVEKVEELRKEFLNSNYVESAGMIASLMHSYVMSKNLEPALALYNEVKEKHGNFKIDEYKIIDTVALMVQKGLHTDGLLLLQKETGKRGARGGNDTLNNCRKLLASYEDEEEQEEMFNFLVENRYCKASNIALGSLIRIHLKKGNVEKAVEKYIFCTNKYGCTPMQLELINAVLKEKNENLLKKITEATTAVHGRNGTILGLLYGFAENQMDKAIRKLLLENGAYILQKPLEDKCQRWIKEDKVNALLTLLKAVKDIPSSNINVNFLHICIMKYYGVKNDCKSAIDFYEELLESETSISQELEKNLYDLLKQSKYEIPKKLKSKLG